MGDVIPEFNNIPIYWINLEKDYERNYNMHLQLNNKPNTLIPGICGKNLPNYELNRYRENSINNYFESEKLSPGEVGCLLSHIKAIKQSLKQDEEYVIIMEDDADLISWDSNLLKKYICENLSKYDCIQLSVIVPDNYPLPTCCCEHPVIIDWKSEFNRTYPWSLLWSTTCYIISRNGRNKIISAFENGSVLTPSDMFIYDNTNTGTLFPSVVGYFSNFSSNIQDCSIVDDLHHVSYMRITEKYFKKQLILITTWFGELPHYIHIWLSTVKNQAYDILFITDQNVIDFPNNVKIIKMSFDSFNDHINKVTGFNVKLKNFAKLVDVKPLYGDLFSNFVKYKYDYWGWTDIDMMMGDLTKVVINNPNYDVYTFGMPSFGPIMIFSVNYMKFYLKIDRYEDILNDPLICKVDEPWWFLRLNGLTDLCTLYDENSLVKYYSGKNMMEVFVEDNIKKYTVDWIYQCVGIDWDIKNKIHCSDVIDIIKYGFYDNTLRKNNQEIYFSHMTYLKRLKSFSNFFTSLCSKTQQNNNESFIFNVVLTRNKVDYINISELNVLEVYDKLINCSFMNIPENAAIYIKHLYETRNVMFNDELNKMTVILKHPINRFKDIVRESLLNIKNPCIKNLIISKINTPNKWVNVLKDENNNYHKFLTNLIKNVNYYIGDITFNEDIKMTCLLNLFTFEMHNGVKNIEPCSNPTYVLLFDNINEEFRLLMSHFGICARLNIANSTKKTLESNYLSQENRIWLENYYKEEIEVYNRYATIPSKIRLNIYE